MSPKLLQQQQQQQQEEEGVQSQQQLLIQSLQQKINEYIEKCVDERFEKVHEVVVDLLRKQTPLIRNSCDALQMEIFHKFELWKQEAQKAIQIKSQQLCCGRRDLQLRTTNQTVHSNSAVENTTRGSATVVVDTQTNTTGQITTPTTDSLSLFADYAISDTAVKTMDELRRTSLRLEEHLNANETRLNANETRLNSIAARCNEFHRDLLRHSESTKKSIKKELIASMVEEMETNKKQILENVNLIVKTQRRRVANNTQTPNSQHQSHGSPGSSHRHRTAAGNHPINRNHSTPRNNKNKKTTKVARSASPLPPSVTPPLKRTLDQVDSEMARNRNAVRRTGLPFSGLTRKQQRMVMEANLRLFRQMASE